MSKKIILIGTAYPYRGGLASYNERLIKEFCKEGDDAVIWTFTLQYPKFLFPGKTQLSTSSKPNDINIYRKVNSVNPFNWIKIGRELKKAKPDLIIFKYWIPFMSLCFGVISRIAKKNKKTRIISIIDNIIPHEKRIGDRFLSAFFVKSMDAFVVMSKNVLEDLKKFNLSKPRLFNPHPLFDNFGELILKREAIKKLGLKEGDKHILFFGFVRDYKGLDLLLKAFADSRFRNNNFKLIIAGEYYNNEQKYIDLIQELGIKNEVILRNNFIPDEEVKLYFGAADIVALPYKNATQSGVTQIGYHFEKPMLVTNVGGLSEIIPHNKVGYVVESNSDSIANSLIEFYEKQREEEMIKNVRLEKEKYSWNKMVQTINTLFDELQK